MKTPIAVLATVALLAGCTIDRRTIVTETTPPTTTEKSQPPTASSDDNETVFLQGVRTVHEGPVYVTDAELLNAGWAVCEAANNGSTIWEIADAVTQAASDQDTYNLLMEVTIGALMFLCPQYEHLLNDLNEV